MSFVDSHNGWLLQGSGTESIIGMRVLQTVDGGRTWNIEYQGDQRFPDAIQFIDTLHGWIVAPASPCDVEAVQCDRTIMYTRDGGHSWKSSHLGSISSDDVRFVDPSVGWLLESTGECVTCAQYPIFLLRSDDGGASWETVLRGEGPGALVVADARVAWVFTQSGAQRTIDGGATWVDQPAPCGADQDASRPLGVIAGFAQDSRSVWVACGQGSTDGLQRVYRSDSGGANWQRLYDAGPLGPYPSHFSLHAYRASLTFFDQAHGVFIPTSGGPIEKTADGGQSWAPVHSLGGRIAQFLTSKIGWASGLWFTVDGGARWEYLPLHQ